MTSVVLAFSAYMLIFSPIASLAGIFFARTPHVLNACVLKVLPNRSNFYIVASLEKGSLHEGNPACCVVMTSVAFFSHGPRKLFAYVPSVEIRLKVGSMREI